MAQLCQVRYAEELDGGLAVVFEHRGRWAERLVGHDRLAMDNQYSPLHPAAALTYCLVLPEPSHVVRFETPDSHL